VLRQLVPALLLVVPATTALWAGIEFVQAEEECRARPGSTSPPGSGWYYRVNRVDHRRCWFLVAKNAGTHLARPRHFAGDSTGSARQEQQTGAQPQIASSQIELADDTVSAVRSTVPQAAAPALDAATKYLVPRSVPTITFRHLSPDARTPFGATLNAAGAAEQSSARVGNSSLTLVALAEAAATSSLFVGGGLFVTLLLRRRSQKQAILRRYDPQIAAPSEVSVVRDPPTASSLPSTPPGTADDFSQSLRELRHSLTRAEASIQRRFSERTFSNRSHESAF
jgi:hypothetical protein